METAILLFAMEKAWATKDNSGQRDLWIGLVGKGMASGCEGHAINIFLKTV